jgi:protein-S-isoprenylcysteine O-methyltransferase Ste14
MIVAGLPVLLDSFGRFALQGLGTPAPIAPPERLVVTGLYRYVRNPMYVAVALLIFGQGLFFGSPGLLEYGVVVSLGFFAFVVFYEEPALRRKFGEEYEQFCDVVPRWVPRMKLRA